MSENKKRHSFWMEGVTISSVDRYDYHRLWT